MNQGPDRDTEAAATKNVRMSFGSDNDANVIIIANQDLTHGITVTHIPRTITKVRGEANVEDHKAPKDIPIVNESQNRRTSHLLSNIPRPCDGATM